MSEFSSSWYTGLPSVLRATAFKLLLPRVAFSSMLVTPNRSKYPRRAAVVNYFADGVVCSDSDEPLLNGVPAIPQGHRMEGQFFPLVYDPVWTV